MSTGSKVIAQTGRQTDTHTYTHTHRHDENITCTAYAGGKYQEKLTWKTAPDTVRRGLKLSHTLYLSLKCLRLALVEHGIGKTRLKCSGTVIRVRD